MSNILGRELPTHLAGYGELRPFAGAARIVERVTRALVHVRCAQPGRAKVLPNLAAAIEASNLRDGATLAFHHHLRNGDAVLNQVLAEVARMGLRDIRIAASALFPVHAPLVDHVRSGVVTGISTSYMTGPIADAISCGDLAEPVVMYTHGGRARAIEAGDRHIDAAFVAAPTADTYGNINGTQGNAACGTLGYPMVDVQYADTVVAVTDNLVPYPASPIDITQDTVDFVVAVESIGDSEGIVSGATRMTADPVNLKIAQTAAAVIAASGLLQQGFSFQTGAGGISLAVAADLARLMHARKITGSFASGGITGGIVDMLEAGLFRALFDVQCFDLRAVDSYRRNPAHQSMSASTYANPHNRGAVVNMLDAVILGAAEIDLDFNVNVTTGSDGRILGGSGGHADTAAGAKLAIVTSRLAAGSNPKVVERVTTATTPGESIDVLVTEAGIAVNPCTGDLGDRLRAQGLRVVEIAELQQQAARHAAPRASLERHTRPVAVVEYRDGTIIDVVHAIA